MAPCSKSYFRNLAGDCWSVVQACEGSFICVYVAVIAVVIVAFKTSRSKIKHYPRISLTETNGNCKPFF